MTILKSDIITKADDLDLIIDSGQYGSVKGVTSHYAATGAIADNDVVLMCEVPVDAFITSVRFASDDLGTTGDLNVGFYPGDGSGVTIAAATDAVDEDCIATAIDVNAAAVALTEIRFEVKGIETIKQKAWELASLSARPSYNKFFVALTASEATTAAGDMILVVEYLTD